MTKHLASCEQRRAVSETSSGKQKPQKTKLFHLVVEGHDLPEYWMHLEAPAEATLGDLDRFLRNIWLECCGHLSAFTIEGKSYDEDGGMDVTLGKILSPGMKFYHEYDFGSTTELVLKVVSERDGQVSDESILLMSRNDTPLIMCVSCGKPARQVCVECLWDGEGWLCNKCAKKHECGEDMLLPVVNSPRVGVCGYTGGEDWEE
ncbi:MAG: hypothetical protein QME81_02935 [bacterium]|nr:hypothetical protein [bacterium]